ncbi:hypothetical protein LZL87_014048 [Fusarium oxysporum]|nr:hypothetical protein LZL87_014048 [Fusarium oxysporum]
MAANDTCLYHMYQQLDPSMRPADIKERRIRCYKHTLNLVPRAFLLGKDANSFELESDINSMRGLIEQDLDHWRTKGPIGIEYLLEHFKDCKVFYSEVAAEIVGETHLDATERIATAPINFPEKRSASETSQKSTLPADHQAYIRASINNSDHSASEARNAKVGIKDYFTYWYDANLGLCEETIKYDAALRAMGQEDDQYTQWINSKTKKAFATSGSVGELERYLCLEPQGFVSFTEQLCSGCLCYSSDGKRL